MKKREIDVAVIGAGVSGCSAAISAARKGLKTVVIEKNKDPIKLACGEAVSSYLLGSLPFDIPNYILSRRKKGIRFYVEDIFVKRCGILWESYTVERKDINPWLYRKAVNSGAQIYFNSRIARLEVEEEKITSISVEGSNDMIEFRPKVVIAADGVDSFVAKSLGVYRERKYRQAHIVSFEMKKLNLLDSCFEQIYFGDFAPKGFAYIFPKSKSRANVGVGTLSEKNDARDLFQEFLSLDIVSKQVGGGKVIIDRTGYAPVNYSMDRIVYGNVLFTGDAANQNIKPFIEGLLPGIICGYLAGTSAYSFLKEGKSLDREYEKLLKEKMGELFSTSDNILSIMIDVLDKNDDTTPLLLFSLGSQLFDLNYFKYLISLSYNELKDKIKTMISHFS